MVKKQKNEKQRQEKAKQPAWAGDEEGMKKAMDWVSKALGKQATESQPSVKGTQGQAPEQESRWLA